MKKKVLFVNHSLQQGGIVRSLIAALNVLDPNKYEITLYVHRDQPDLKDLLPEWVNLIVNQDRHHYFRLPKSVFLQLASKFFAFCGDSIRATRFTQKLNSYIRSRKVLHPLHDYFKNSCFDVVIAYSVDICTEIALSIPAAHHYAFFHSSNGDFHREMTEVCFPKYDRIIAVSPGVEAVVKEAFPALEKRIICLSNYVDGEMLHALSKQGPGCEKKDGCFTICSCGRLSQEKGYDLAVKAADIIKRNGISFVWYFVGDGSERQTLEKQISDLGLQDHIIITGFLLNPYPYVRSCDIFVQPSYEEAQPMSLLEAQKLGRAVVSTDTVGGRTILENGKKGVLTPITAQGLAEGIVSLLQNEQKRNSYMNMVNESEDKEEKRVYTEKWNRLLSE